MNNKLILRALVLIVRILYNTLLTGDASKHLGGDKHRSLLFETSEFLSGVPFDE